MKIITESKDQKSEEINNIIMQLNQKIKDK